MSDHTPARGIARRGFLAGVVGVLCSGRLWLGVARAQARPRAKPPAPAGPANRPTTNPPSDRPRWIGHW